jgi:hypothetical protein
MNTGLELRRLLVGISNQKINVITHSHGAGVITAALFNVRKFDEDRKVFSTEFTEEIDLKYKMKIYDCATQEFHVGMLAPAIPGENVFDEYFQRTISGVDSLTTKKKPSLYIRL